MQKILIIVLGAVLLGAAGIWTYDRLTKEKVSGALSIKKDDAKSLDVDIDFGAGSFLIEGGAKEWVDGNIDANIKKWYPSVTYKNKKDIGYVKIQQKGTGLSILRKQRNNWKLQLTNEIPVRLDVEMGVSDSELDLAGIRLSHLSVDAGVGDTIINLDDDWQESFDVELDLGVGGATIYLPKDIGVELVVDKGVGSIEAKDFISKGKGIYVNEAYGRSDTTIHVEVDVGVGGVKFLLGN